MKRDWTVTQADFDALLAWLDPDREQAAAKYEEIRSRLIHIFICRGSVNAEDLADRTIDRVIRKLSEFSKPYSGNPALYFYGVAKNIYLESLRTASVSAKWDPAAKIPEDDSRELDCLDKCMKEFPADTRRLMIAYYEHAGQAKIETRKRLAAELGIDTNALRIRTHRLRARLEECVRRCLGETE
jgi:RNA polymerase sigma factor (sigma-70 family)